MKPSFILFLFAFSLSTATFGQSKEALNLEISNLKAQVQNLDQKNQELIVKTATLQKDIEFLQRQIDELKAQRIASPMPPAANAPLPPGYPSAPSTQQAPPPPPPAAVKTTGQYGRCRATTQKGTQCSRNAKSNGYCYQHGGV
ncbi:MAG: DUF5763 domain-containing protein [Sphingomonadales bacterium]